MTRTLHRGTYDEIVTPIRAASRGHKVALDLGCGYGQYLLATDCPVKIGIELFSPYTFEAVQGVCIVVADMRKWREVLPACFDYVQMIDSLEHLPKEDGVLLIKDLQSCESVRTIFIFFPVGDDPQEPCDGNEAQRHLSTWTLDDMRALGFEVQPWVAGPGTPDAKDVAFARWRRS